MRSGFTYTPLKSQTEASLDNCRNKCRKGQVKEKFRLNKKRNAKAITEAMAKRLCGLNNNELKGYIRMHECCNYMVQDGNKIIGHAYCKHRLCNVCNRIRATKLTLQYGQELLDLPEQHFITLTAPNVSGDELRSEIRKFGAFWRYFYQKQNKKGVQLQGIRKLECTYNYKAKTYNPHYHVLVGSEADARTLMFEWLKYRRDADPSGQNIKKVTGDQRVLMELFKYMTKPITDKQFEAKAMDTIYQACKGLHTIRAFGITRHEVDLDDFTDLASQTITYKGNRIEVWKWCDTDWISPEGEKLIDTPMDKKHKDIIKIISTPITKPKPKPKTASQVMETVRKDITEGKIYIEF